MREDIAKEIGLLEPRVQVGRTLGSRSFFGLDLNGGSRSFFVSVPTSGVKSRDKDLNYFCFVEGVVQE